MNRISLMARRHGWCVLWLLLLGLAAGVVSEAHGQIVLTKLGSVKNSSLRRVKSTVIGGVTYPVALFGSGVVVMDQNASVVAEMDLYSCRALAVNGDLIYVVGKLTESQGGYEVIKLLFDPVQRKLSKVGNAAGLASLMYSHDLGNYSNDMCVTGGRVWLCTAATTFPGGNTNGTPVWRMSAYAEGDRTGDLKLITDISRAQNVGYYDANGTYQWGKDNAWIDANPAGRTGNGVFLAADPAEAGVFWMALPDANDTSLRLLRLWYDPYDGGLLRTTTQPSSRSGGIGLFGASEGAGNPVLNGLAVDGEYVYATCWSVRALTKVFRVAKSYFGSGYVHTNASRNIPVAVARVENPDGVDLGTSSEFVQPSGLVVSGGQVTLAGVYGRTQLKFSGTGGGDIRLPLLGRSNIYVARLRADFTAWEIPVRLPDALGTPQPLFSYNTTALVPATTDGSNFLLVSRLTEDGVAKFDAATSYNGAGNHFALLLSAGTNLPTTQRFQLTISAEGRAPGGTTTVPLALGQAGLTPGFGLLSRDAGTSVTATSPEQIYQRADGTFLNLTGKTPAEIQTLIESPTVTARYRVTGYTVTRAGDAQIETGTGNSVTLVLTKNSAVTFNYTRDYALTISSDLTGLPGIDAAGGQTLGFPEPATGKHWIEEETEVAPEVDVIALSATDSGTRYLATGYASTGLGDRQPTTAFGGTLTRQTVKKFTVAGAVNITYKWKPQHSLAMNASVPEAANLVAVKAPAGVTEGSGIVWFDRGTEITVGATDSAANAMTGVYSGTGALVGINQFRRGQLTATFDHTGRTYVGHKLTLNSGGTIAWDYGQPRYLQVVSIGSPVVLGPVDPPVGNSAQLTPAIAAAINTNIAPVVTSFGDAPNGTQLTNAFLWSPQERKAYPVRPGTYLLEWTRSDGQKLVMEIVAGFPGDTVRHTSIPAGRKFDGLRRHLRAALHQDMPALNLDPQTGDQNAFVQYVYSAKMDDVAGNLQSSPETAPQLNGAMMSFNFNGKAVSTANGRHVLAFTRSLDQNPATGDLTREKLLVRVLETREWNAAARWEPASATNKALLLNGSTSFVRTSLRQLKGDELTIQYWFKGTKIQSAVRLQQGNNYILAPWQGRKWTHSAQADPLGDTVVLSDSMENNHWHLVTMMWKRGEVNGMTAYVDGVRQSSRNATANALPVTDAELIFGAFFNGTTSSEWTNGYMDEISIWNRVLTPAEINAAFTTRRQMTGIEPGLTGYWNFDDGTANDLGPGGYHGILEGGATITTEAGLPPLVAADDQTGTAMIASRDTPVAVVIPQRITDVLDTAGIGTGFVTGRLARYNASLYSRESEAGSTGPVFPVNQTTSTADADDFTVVWYERKDGALWPWRPRKYNPGWPTLATHRIVVASQLGSDGLENSRLSFQPKFDAATTSSLAVYAQNDPAKPGFNPNEEHALVSGSLLYSALQPAHSAVYALRNDLNNASKTSPPWVLAQWTNLESGQPQMRAYQVVMKDENIKPFPSTSGWSELRSGSLSNDNGRLNIQPPVTVIPGEPIRLEVLEGGISGLSAAQTVYPIAVPGYTKVAFSLTPGGEAFTTATTTFTTVVARISRLYPYTFDYFATAGQPVPVPNPLSSVIGATPSPKTSGGEDSAYTSVSTAPSRVFYKDYRGMAWVVSGGGARFWTKFFYPLAESFYRYDAAGNPLIKTENGVLKESDGTEWLPGSQVNYVANWPAETAVLKVGETLTFSGGEYREDHPNAPGLPGVVGWAAGKVVYDSSTPAMDRAIASTDTNTVNAANGLTFTNYTARLVAPLETRRVQLANVLSEAEIADLKSKIAPATGIVTVDGALWRFRNLPASLRTRVFFDPIANELGIKGYVNGKTLGDQTLTATPEPAYILDPNIMRTADMTLLRDFKADLGETKMMKDVHPRWERLVEELFALSRDPSGLVAATGSSATRTATPYYAGLQLAPQRDADGNILRYTDSGTLPSAAKSAEVPKDYPKVPGQPVPTKLRAAPASLLGPGLALVCSPEMLRPVSGQADVDAYVTLAENDDARLGLPVTMHVVKLARKHRYRGAIRLVEGDNALSEKVTLRHTADFGANTDLIEFQWFYRPEDGRSAAVPYANGSIGAWQLFPDATSAQLDMNAQGKYILPDLWFLARYRHLSDSGPAIPASWANSRWASDGKPDPLVTRGELWAGAANSPQPDGEYLAQLVPGWLKRVLDRINPYEARFTDFRTNNAPATYASMLQQAGPAYNGPVALNPNKDVIENTGLIQLYQTILERAKKFGLDPAITDPALRSAIMNALQLAATRVQDLYMVIANEAYADSQDPLIGLGAAGTTAGSGAASIWTFMNQTSDPLEEELALLRGGSFSFGRPVYNRLFWNFTKDLGEVAYAQTYNLSDENRDGFINESDAMLRYPMGHGDAWGHYTTALKMHYDLLRNAEFRWQPRSEFYSLLNTVIPVDFYDERKFAAAAAARARAGADIVNLTYRQRYTENPDGQWQGYADTDFDRAWGVEQWARRAGQAALVDWVVANSLLPATTANRGDAIPVERFDDAGSSTAYRLTLGGPTNPLPIVTGTTAPRYLLTLRVGDATHEAIFTAAGAVQSETLRLSNFQALYLNGIQSVTAFTVTLPGTTAAPGLTTANVTLARHDRAESIQRVDRTTVGALDSITREHARIENTLMDVNGGLNPLGLAKDAVPFDIDPGLYTGRTGTQPVSHFEQIYDRARRAVANANVIFTASSEALAQTRENQDTLEEFSRDVAERDRDYRNRLIEIFGTPHAGNIGTGKPYPAGYNGPDLYFHAYVDVNTVDATSIPQAKNTTSGFQAAVRGFRQQILLNFGEDVTKLQFDSSDWDDEFSDTINNLFLNDYDKTVVGSTLGRLESTRFLSTSPVTLNLPVTAAGYTFRSDAAWGQRQRTGELQTLISQMVQAEAELATTVADYSRYVAEVDAAAETVAARHATALESLDSLEKERAAIIALSIARAGLSMAATFFRSSHERAQELRDFYLAVTPETVIAGLANGGDFARSFNALTLLPIATASAAIGTNAAVAEAGIALTDVPMQTSAYNVAIADLETGAKYDLQQQLIAIKVLLKDEPVKRIAILNAMESLRQASDAYRSRLHAGLDLLDERAEFNRNTAGVVQEHRYHDMTYRLLRNEGLDKYHAAFELAAKYTWLAARAYQYETNLPENHPAAAGPILEGIVSARLAGDVIDGEPVQGDGLADALATLRDNYSVLKGQLGLNNAQAEDSRISLRHELLRLRSSQDADFRAQINTYRQADLNKVPEFRRFCRPFAPTTTVQPGLVIPMPTTIGAGRNLFGKPLGPGDHAFDPSLFATKVSGVGVWFEGYDLARFASAPRVYLVPAGNDAMLEPQSTTFTPRWWTVVDQRIPLPFLLGAAPLGDPDWRPVQDTLDGLPGEIRKFSSFRAYAGSAGSTVSTAEMTFDSRLVGRSVWNDKWLLIIPGQTLGADPAAALTELLGPNGITDIHLVFKTFGFSGN